MKKIISLLLAVLIVITAVISSAVFVSAATYVTYGDWLLAVNSDTTYLVGGYNGTDTVLSFPETANNKAVIGVAEDFYDHCESELTSVTLPNSYTTIESFAFYQMTSLESINIPSNLSSFGAMAFSGCTSLTAVDMSNAAALTTIPYACFNECALLDEVAFPEQLITISDYAFSNTAVQSVTLPITVTSIGEYCFNECSSLADIQLPSGLTTIGKYAFYNDTALTTIYVPATVTSIGNFAFNPMAIQGGPLTLDCYADTYAAEYAYENYLNYTTEAFVRGDVDGNGVVNIRDVTYIQLYLLKRYNIDINAKTLDKLDLNGDKQISIRDATMIQMYKVHLIDYL